MVGSRLVEASCEQLVAITRERLECATRGARVPFCSEELGLTVLTACASTTGTTRSRFETAATGRAEARGARAYMCASARTGAQWAGRALKHLFGRGLVDAKARMRWHTWGPIF